MSEQIETGEYLVGVACPNCGEPGTVAAELRTVLKVVEDDESSLSVRCRAKPVPHACNQVALTVDPQTGVLS